MRNRQTVLIALLILVTVISGIVVTLVLIGRSYEGGLRGLENQDTGEPVSSVSTRNIRKITLRNDGDSRCTEIGADGVVRVYETCGGEVSDAFRTSETRVVSDLFNRLGSRVTSQRPTGSFIEVVIETDDGEMITVYIPRGENGESGTGNGGSESGGDIIDLIDIIIDSSPTPAPTSQPQPTVSPPPTGIPGQPTPTPTPYVVWYGTPMPTPTGTVGTFTCDFDEGDAKIPYRVSNVVCSTEPIPVP